MNMSIGADHGSSAALQRWIEAVRDEASVSRALDSRLREPEAVAEPGAHRRLRPDLRTALLTRDARERRLEPTALGAHAAVGELEIQAATYRGVEQALSENGSDVEGALLRVDEAYERARERRVAARRDAGSGPAPGRSLEPAGDDAEIDAAVREAARAVESAGDRLVQGRREALGAVRDAVAKADALAREVAADNGRIASDREAGRPLEPRVDERRDTAVRELARLVGATVVRHDDDTVEISLDGLRLVDGGRARRLDVEETAPDASAPGRPRTAPGTAGAAETAAATPPEPDAPPPTPPPVVRILADGEPIARPAGALAARLAMLDVVLPGIDDRLDALRAAVVLGVAERDADAGTASEAPRLTRDDTGRLVPSGDVPAFPAPVLADSAAPSVAPPALAPAPVAPAAPVVAASAPPAAAPAPVGPVVPAAPGIERGLAGALGVLDDLRAEVSGRLRDVDRRLDVLSVVDAVLSGAPVSQVGGLVSAALGATPASPSPTRPGQHLVSSLQTLDALVHSLGAVADAVTAGTWAPIVRSQAPELVGVTPLAGEDDPAAFRARVDVLDVATAGVVASAATFPPGVPLGGGRPFELALVEGFGGPGPRTTHVHLGAGTTLAGVARAIETAAPGVRAQVESGPEGDRLFLTSAVTGAGTDLAVLDGRGTGRPSDALGGFVRPAHGSDTVLRVGVDDAPPTLVRGPSTTFAGVLPGVRLDIARELAGAGPHEEPAHGPAAQTRMQTRTATPLASVEVSVLPDRAPALDAAARLVASAGAALEATSGRGPLEPQAAAVLRADPVVGELVARIASVLVPAPRATSAPASSPSVSTPTMSTPSVASPPVSSPEAPAAPGVTPDAVAVVDGRSPGRLPSAPGLPGVRLGRDDRLELDRRAFLAAFDDDPVGVETSVRHAARELGALARDASDPRTGVIPVRIHGEQDRLHDYALAKPGGQDRARDRAGTLSDRTVAMQSLLERLDGEQTWLGAQLT